MKTRPIFLLLFLLTFYANAQERKLESRTRPSENLEGKVFNRITGEPFTNAQLGVLFKENPGLSMEMLYDKNGNLEKCLYDPNDPFKKYPRDPEKRPKIGEPFPEFVFTTIDGKRYGSEDLKGNWILIYFRAFAENIQKEQLELLASEFQKAKEAFNITAFGVFAYNDDLEHIAAQLQSDFNLVNNASGFFSKFHLIQSPTTVLIDPEGTTVKYFYPLEKINILPILEAY